MRATRAHFATVRAAVPSPSQRLCCSSVDADGDRHGWIAGVGSEAIFVARGTGWRDRVVVG